MGKLRTAVILFDILVFLTAGWVLCSGIEDEKEPVSGVDVRTVSRDETGEVQEVKKVCLTFDDGPHPYYTEQLLDGLKERDVRAAFFVTGEHAQLHPEVIMRMYREGHTVGNHTYSHMQLTKSNREQFREELLRTSRILTEITGSEVNYVRPPYGTWDKSLEEELNMIPVLWTVDPLDWCREDVGCILRSVLSGVKDNSIILLHDYYASSVTAALSVVDELKKQGYEFVSIDEMILD